MSVTHPYHKLSGVTFSSAFLQLYQEDVVKGPVLSLIALALLAGCDEKPATQAMLPLPTTEQCAQSTVRLFPEDKCQVSSGQLVSEVGTASGFPRSTASGWHGGLEYSVTLTSASGIGYLRAPDTQALTQDVSTLALPRTQSLQAIEAGDSTYIPFTNVTLQCFYFMKRGGSTSHGFRYLYEGTFCDHTRADTFTQSDMADLVAQIKGDE